MVDETNVIRSKVHSLLDILEKQMVKDTNPRMNQVDTILQAFKFTDELKYHLYLNGGYELQFYMLRVDRGTIMRNNNVQIKERYRIVNLLAQAVELGELNLLEVEEWLLKRIT